jgi:hypothetical protein
MKSHSVPSSRERFYVLDAKNRPVEVFDRGDWSRWMTENELIFRRTLLDESGGRSRPASAVCPNRKPGRLHCS